MTEIQLTFREDMAQAILEGRKTQTRRPDRGEGCPFGEVGELIRVKEPWRIGAWKGGEIAIDYRAGNYARKEWLPVGSEALYERWVAESIQDAEAAGILPDVESGELSWELGAGPCRWRSAEEMPESFSRSRLLVKRIWREKLWNMTAADMEKEGLGDPQESLIQIGMWVFWDSFYLGTEFEGKRNPLVWACEFELVKEEAPDE